MNAIEFVKCLNNGIRSAKEIMEVRPYMLEGVDIDMGDLQELVNAYELVEQCNAKS